MTRRVVTAVMMVLVVAATAQAQTKFEISALGGYTFSGGISGSTVSTPSGVFNGVSVKSGGSLGLSFGVLTGNGGEIGFEWGRQWSALGIRGVPTIDIGNMSIDHYHAYFAYTAMPEAKARPYLSFGIGATDYGTVAYTGPNQSGEILGPVRVSVKVGVGIKTQASESVGFRAGLNWTPTYITSKDTGWWCDPYWGCYMTADAKYSHQLELVGGITFRFGGQ